MIEEDEFIIYTSQARAAITMKESASMKTGLMEKKIVITTRRCLFFESLSNVVQEIEFEFIEKKKNKKQNQSESQKKRISVNEFPQYFFDVSDRQTKIMIDEEKSCHDYLKKVGIANLVYSITGIVILKNVPKQKFQLLSFAGLRDGFRFCKALACAKAWVQYENYCFEHQIPGNRMWVRILIELVLNEKSIVMIDPDLFLQGSSKQIKSFFVLMSKIPFAHTFQHRFSIINQEAAQYSQDFIQFFQNQTTALLFPKTSLTAGLFPILFPSRIKLQSLIHLDLSSNKLEDEILIYIQQMMKSSKRLSNINLSSNEIKLQDFSLFVSMLKTAQYKMTLDFKYNEISDISLQNIEKFIIFTNNPPIKQINFSFNKFSRRVSWRLFVGNYRWNRFHPSLNFILYPIPFKNQTFPLNPIQYPHKTPENNYNLHSALMEEFQQESFMKHTLNEALNPQKGQIIRLVRNLPQNKKLPRTKEQIRKVHELSNKLENFIYAPQQIENIYEMGRQIQKFDLSLPPASLLRFKTYISDKLNEALFIRDHYSIKYILRTFNKLQIPYNEYLPRIDKVKLRDEKVLQIVDDIINFTVDEDVINERIDNIAREGLRLYLEGEGIQIIYYLKYLRDRYIQKFIYEGYNPEHYIYEKRAEKNMNFQETVTEKDLIIPYEIRVEKRINENFYLHPWSTNYVALSELSKPTYEECEKFLAESTKKQKFAIYFERIEERIQFMKNQFTLFTYAKFKYTYSDLKANSARLISMYKHLIDKQTYLQIPSWMRKKQITKQKIVKIEKEGKFVLEYQIGHYSNINSSARRAGFFNCYKNKISRYKSDNFDYELKKIQDLLKKIFDIFEKQAAVKNKNIPQLIIPDFIELVKKIRQSVYPTELKEQFYLRILSWRNGRNMNNTELLQYLPFFTMYLRPPLPIEKYLVAAIIENQKLRLVNMPLCLVSDVNKATEANIKEQEAEYVERDWIGSKQRMINLMHTNGKVEIVVELLTKRTVVLTVPESRTVGEIVENMLAFNDDRIEDFEHFWLYLTIVESEKTIILDQSQHIGELLINYDDKDIIFVFKRRVYCPEWKYLYKKYSKAMVNSIYYDVKSEYLLGSFFVNDKNIDEIVASMMIIDIIDDQRRKLKIEEAVSGFLNKEITRKVSGYISGKIMNRIMKTKDEIVSNLKDKINEKLLKKEHLSVSDLKIKVLSFFEDYPQFCSTNYLFSDQDGNFMKVSINCSFIYIETKHNELKIMIEKILTVTPKLKHLTIYYHDHEEIVGHQHLRGNQNSIVSAALDIMAYCLIRIKMTSSSLYDIHKYETIMEQHFHENVTKDKNIISQKNQIKRRLERIAPTLLALKEFDYCNYNKFIKGRNTRKLYVKASQQPLELQPEEEEEKKKEGGGIGGIGGLGDNYNLYANVFPSRQNKLKHFEDEEKMEKMEKNEELKNLYNMIPDYQPEEGLMTPKRKQDIEYQIKTEKKEHRDELNTPPNEKPNTEPEVITTVKPPGQRKPPPRKNR